MFDVGGTRFQRKKWIHCFENVDVVLFTVDIACWDQILSEDETVNRMQESLDLFNTIVKCRWFPKTSFVLIFTKLDKLAAKLKVSPIKNYFPDFEGGDELEAAVAYIIDRFTSLVDSDKTIFVQRTSIVDDYQKLGKATMDLLQQVTQLDSARIPTGKITHSR